MVCFETPLKPTKQGSVSVWWSTQMNVMKSFSHDTLFHYQFGHDDDIQNFWSWKNKENKVVAVKLRK